MISNIAVAIIRYYEKYIENLIQYSLFDEQNRYFNAFVAQHFGLNEKSLLPRSLDAKYKKADWVKRFAEFERKGDSAHYLERKAQLKQEVDRSFNHLTAFINFIDKTAVIVQVFPDFPLSVALSEVKALVFQIINDRSHDYPFAHFIKDIELKGFGFEPMFVTFDLSYYDLNLATFFDKAESHIIKVKSLTPLELSYHYFFTQYMIGAFDLKLNAIEKLIVATASMISDSGDSVYNGIRHFVDEEKPKSVFGRFKRTPKNKDFYRVTSQENAVSPQSAIGFQCLGLLTEKADYQALSDNTTNRLSRNHQGVKNVPFIARESDVFNVSPISTLIFELFFDYPIEDENSPNWHLSHRAFFLRYCYLSDFDGLIADFTNQFYRSANKIDRVVYQGLSQFFSRQIAAFVGTREQVKSSDEALAELAEKGGDIAVMHYINMYFYDLNNIASPRPFLTPNTFTREQFFNNALYFDLALFWEKLECLDKPLYQYWKELEQSGILRTDSLFNLIHSTFNYESKTDLRTLAGLSNLSVTEDSTFNSDILASQNAVVGFIHRAFNALFKSNTYISGEVARQCQFVFSLRLNGNFLDQPIKTLLLHQLLEVDLELIFSVQPRKIISLTNEKLEGSLFTLTTSLKSHSQGYLLQYWLTQYPRFDFIAHQYAGELAKRYDVNLSETSIKFNLNV